MTDYEAYTTYLALKLHFSSDYDFFKYNGKVSASPESFKKRKDKYQFLKLSKKLSDEQLVEYFVANIIRDIPWIGQFNQKNWLDHKKINEALEYNYANDLEKLLTNLENFDILFHCDDGNHPKLLKSFLGKKISLETMVILNKLLEFVETFDNQIVENYIWPSVSFLIKKYEPFVKVNTRQFRMITLTNVKEFQ
jgi:hypothetical protein